MTKIAKIFVFSALLAGLPLAAVEPSFASAETSSASSETVGIGHHPAVEPSVASLGTSSASSETVGIGHHPAEEPSFASAETSSASSETVGIGHHPAVEPSAGTVPALPVRVTVSTLNAEAVLDSTVLRAQVEYLSAPSTGGRVTGTKGSQRVIGWIGEHFQNMGLDPIAGTYYHGFRTSAGTFGRNVIGCIKGTSTQERYIVVMAHFDNLGTLNDTFYPGADSNASGVAALLGLARMFAEMRDCGKTYGHSILFVALDAKEQGMAGADALHSLLSHRGMQADLVVNLDQLGSSLAPLHKDRPDYLIMLCDSAPNPSAGRTSASSYRLTLERANIAPGLELDLGFDYYGSRDFTRLFYRNISDQRVFLEHDIPAVMFTSGITLNNNKPHDTPDTLNYTLLTRRVRLIFHFLHRLL